jgi:hypothetical protein
VVGNREVVVEIIADVLTGSALRADVLTTDVPTAGASADVGLTLGGAPHAAAQVPKRQINTHKMMARPVMRPAYLAERSSLTEAGLLEFSQA